MLTNHGQPPRDIWRVSAAERVVNEIYSRLMSTSGGNANGPQGAGGAGGSGGGSHAAEDIKPRSGSAGPPAAGGEGTLASAMSVFFRERVAAANAAGGRSGGGAAGAPGAAPVIRCCCGSNSDRQHLVQCRSCAVWQHRHCVGLGVPTPGSRPAGGDEFFCELCRAKRADPFWQVEDADIAPTVRLSSTGKQTGIAGVMHHMRSGERTFTLTSQQIQKIKVRQAEHQLQLVCLQMNDPVPFRFHWPLLADLRVNTVQYRVYSRNSTQKLGANARDEPANIGQLWSSASGVVRRCPPHSGCSAPGRFHLVMQCADNSAYAMVVLLMRRRSAEEVKRLMAKQLSVEDALKRVQLQLARDDDDELQTGATVVSLRCPILGTRVRTPARFEEVKGLACFDLEAFLDSAARTRKWQCPTSMAHTTVHSLQIDTYMQRIISALANFPSVMEVEVESDGSWRPAGWKDRFYSILEENPLAEAAAAGAGGGSGPSSLGPSAAAAGADSSGGEETDEEEELRRAAAAMSVVVGQKRKRPPTPDIIDLLSSDEEDGAGGCSGASVAEAATTKQHQANGVTRAAGQEGTSTGGAGDTVAPHTNGAALAGATAGPAGAGSGATANAAQHVPLRIVIPARRLVPSTMGAVATQHQHQNVVANGSVSPTGGLGAALAAAGAAAMATQRQHLDQRTSGALSRHQPHHNPSPQTGPHGQQAAQQSHLATAGAPIPHPPPPPPPPPQQQQQQLGVSTVSAAGTGAADGSGGGGLSHHQLVSTIPHVQVRSRLTGGQQEGTAGLTPLPIGAPVTALYQALGRPGTAAAGSMAAGPAVVAVPQVIAGPAAGHNAQQPTQQFAFPIVSQQPQAASFMLHMPWLQQQQQPQPHMGYHAAPQQQQPQAYRPTVGTQQVASAQQYQEQQPQPPAAPPPPPPPPPPQQQQVQQQQQPQTQPQTQPQAQAQGGGVQTPPFPALPNTVAPQAQGAAPPPGHTAAGYGAASNHAKALAIGAARRRGPYECIDLLDDSGEDN
ncbi:hypothetical protein Vafri_4124 [Volvox africanus]|uniref:SP-RING-type domain-containing protein n=1 Tax=Volvox africanus TaxID=51714 RepID=A0A8J4AVQ0_9CHLO|nr:hypothetical protein Vafri_4124 [Volvox africanus]